MATASASAAASRSSHFSVRGVFVAKSASVKGAQASYLADIAAWCYSQICKAEVVSCSTRVAVHALAHNTQHIWQ